MSEREGCSMSAHDVFFVQSPQLGSDSNSGAARNGTPAMENSEVHMKLPAYRSATVFTWCTSVPHRRPVRPVRWPTIRVQLRYTLWRLSTRRLCRGRAWPSGEAGAGSLSRACPWRGPPCGAVWVRGRRSVKEPARRRAAEALPASLAGEAMRFPRMLRRVPRPCQEIIPLEEIGVCVQ